MNLYANRSYAGNDSKRLPGALSAKTDILEFAGDNDELYPLNYSLAAKLMVYPEFTVDEEIDIIIGPGGAVVGAYDFNDFSQAQIDERIASDMEALKSQHPDYTFTIKEGRFPTSTDSESTHIIYIEDYKNHILEKGKGM